MVFAEAVVEFVGGVGGEGEEGGVGEVGVLEGPGEEDHADAGGDEGLPPPCAELGEGAEDEAGDDEEDAVLREFEGGENEGIGERRLGGLAGAGDDAADCAGGAAQRIGEGALRGASGEREEAEEGGGPGTGSEERSDDISKIMSPLLDWVFAAHGR